MWTDFVEPSHTILAGAAVARERARSKKRRKQQPRSKRKSIGASHATFNKPRQEKPTLVIPSYQLTVSLVHADPVLLDLGTSRDEQTKSPQAPSLQVASIIGEPDGAATPTRLSQIKNGAAVEVEIVALPPEPAETISHEEFDGLTAATSVPSVLAASELQSAKRRPYPFALKRVGLTAVGSFGLLGALWLLNPIPNREGGAITVDQAATPVRVWTDAAPLEQGQTAAENPQITPRNKQELIVAPTDAAVVQEPPLEEAPFTGRAKDHQLVEATAIGLAPVPREVAKSVAGASVPLPPRRPVSLLIRHVPAAHPVSIVATIPAPAPSQTLVEQSEPSESYATFSAHKHEIGTHKLPWGMARLHEDANSDSGRGAVWDFVPTEP